MRLLVVDGNSIANRAFFGIKVLTTKDGQYTNAIYGFMNILLSLTQNYQPDEVAIAFDLPAPTFRHKMYDSYKANRHGMPDELAACKSRHPYDLDTFNERYPALPQQENFTAADFARYAVGSGWKCAEAYRMETAGRYDAAQPVTAAARATADCMYISADTITTYAAPDGSVTAKGADARYTYHANGFYLSTGPAAGFKIISVDDAEMRIVRRLRPAEGQKAANMYCVYRKMTDGELLQLRPEAAEGRQDLASK